MFDTPRLDIEARRRVVALRRHGYSVPAIKQRLLEEHISVSITAIYCLLRKNEIHNTIVDRPWRCITKKLDKEKLRFIDDALACNDELTASRLLMQLQEKWPDLRVSLSTIKRSRKEDLGWVKSKPKYCQLIRTANKEKRLE